MEVIIKSRKPQYTTIKCPGCNAILEFELPTGVTTGKPKYNVQCYNTLCEKLVPFDPSKPTSPNLNGSAKPGPSSSTAGFSFTTNGAKGAAAKAFKIGSDEEPASLEYYELLGVTHKADTAEIKKAYYRLAMKFHPDKNKTPEAEEMFKKISEAYQVLSDPVLRKKYNEFGPGKGSDPEGGFINPEDFFKMQFGGELFVDIIGELQIAKEFKNMMMKNGEGEDGEEEKEEHISVTLEKRREELEAKKKAREERVSGLAENLKKKLNVYLEQGPDHFKKFIIDEAEELKVQSYGVHLLHSIGYVYSVKASEYISKYSDDLFSTPSLFHRMRLKGRAVSETFSTVKSAVDVHHTFVQLQEAEKTGASEAEREKLTEEAVKKGTDAIWKTSKLEVEGIIRSVCDKTLTDITVDRVTLRKRSEALKIVGDIYQSVTPPQMPPNMF